MTFTSKSSHRLLCRWHLMFCLLVLDSLGRFEDDSLSCIYQYRGITMMQLWSVVDQNFIEIFCNRNMVKLCYILQFTPSHNPHKSANWGEEIWFTFTMPKENIYMHISSVPPCASCGTLMRPDDPLHGRFSTISHPMEKCLQIIVIDIVSSRSYQRGLRPKKEMQLDWRSNQWDFQLLCIPQGLLESTDTAFRQSNFISWYIEQSSWRSTLAWISYRYIIFSRFPYIVFVHRSSWLKYQGHLIPNTDIPSSSWFRNIAFKREAKNSFPKAVNMHCEDPPGQENQKSDCFRLLPLELRFEIAYLLPTVEYLNLRLASKAMIHIFYALEYWKSRFFIHRERGYLTYLLEKDYCRSSEPLDTENLDWLLMYHCTKRPKTLIKTLRYRRLQWLHNEWIKDRCIMYGGPKSIPSDNPNNFYGLLWDSAIGVIQCDRPVRYKSPEGTSFEKGTCLRCCGMHNLSPRQIIFLPSELVEMEVSVLAEDEHSFITGFCIKYGENLSRIDFGYQIPGKQIKIDFRNRELRGFEVFAGNGGIQAFCPIFKQEGQNYNSVIGNPDSTCYEIPLTPDGEIRAFTGNFDVSQIFVFRCSSSPDE